MEKINYIRFNDGELVNISNIEKIYSHTSKVIKDSDINWPYKKISKGEPIKTFFGFVLKRAECDCYGICNTNNPFYTEYFTYSFKEFFEFITNNFGRLHCVGYHHIGLQFSNTKEALTFDEQTNSIFVKPYVEFVKGYYSKTAFKVFDTDKEMEVWLENMGINIMSKN